MTSVGNPYHKEYLINVTAEGWNVAKFTSFVIRPFVSFISGVALPVIPTSRSQSGFFFSVTSPIWNVAKFTSFVIRPFVSFISGVAIPVIPTSRSQSGSSLVWRHPSKIYSALWLEVCQRKTEKCEMPLKATRLQCRFLLRVTDPCNESFTSIATKPPHLCYTLQNPDNILDASQ